MAKGQAVITHDVNGNDITSERIGAVRFRLVQRVVNDAEFTSQWYSKATIKDIAKHWDISEPDVANLAKYLALPNKVRGGEKHINTSKLIEELRPMIKAMVDEAIAEALK